MPTLIWIFSVLSLLSTAIAFAVRQKPHLTGGNLDGLSRNIRAGLATMMLVIFGTICAFMSAGTAFLLWPTMSMSMRLVGMLPALVLVIWGALRVKW